MARRRDDVLGKGLPWLVAERDGEVLGYAYANQFRPRRAYRFCLEDSIYLAPTRPGPGRRPPAAGRAAGALRSARRAPDAGGDRRLGQRRLDRRAPRARLRAHRRAASAAGWKFDRWLDVVLMQKRARPRRSTRRPTQPMTRRSSATSKTLATWIALLGGSLGPAPLLPARLARSLGLAASAADAARPVRRAAHARARPGRPARLAADPAARADARRSDAGAIVYGLTPDERWNARFNPAGAAHRTRLGDRDRRRSLALMLGAGVLMATIAFSGQRYFEYQIEAAREDQPVAARSAEQRTGSSQ